MSIYWMTLFPILTMATLCATELQLDKKQTMESKYLLPSGSRTFVIEYTASVQDVPPGTKTLRIWLPVPQSSTVQRISNLTFSRPPKSRNIEPKYSNEIAYWEITNPSTNLELTMKFTCIRSEVRMNLDALGEEGNDAPELYSFFKGPDALVVVDKEMQDLAAQITAGKIGTLSKARAIYEYVLEKMTYDKAHEGWGLGSTRHACEVGKGNCTDFHALFNSLCRAQGIASGFEIGLYLPYDQNSKEAPGGYHCWALFRIPGKSWVPVDCSEADRIPEKKDFFFGGHTSNRVTLSTGRDLILEPKQAGDPLNYFVNPYAEADEKPVKTSKTWTHKDL